MHSLPCVSRGSGYAAVYACSSRVVGVTKRKMLSQKIRWFLFGLGSPRCYWYCCLLMHATYDTVFFRNMVYRVSVNVIIRQGRGSEATEPVFCLQAKKPLHSGSDEHRVPKIKKLNIFLYQGWLFVYLFVWSNIVNGHVGRPYSTHTVPMPVLTGSVHAHILTKPSRAGFAVSRLELIEPGAATCVLGMAGPCLKSLERTYQVQVPVLP